MSNTLFLGNNDKTFKKKIIKFRKKSNFLKKASKDFRKKSKNPDIKAGEVDLIVSHALFGQVSLGKFQGKRGQFPARFSCLLEWNFKRFTGITKNINWNYKRYSIELQKTFHIYME